MNSKRNVMGLMLKKLKIETNMPICLLRLGLYNLIKKLSFNSHKGTLTLATNYLEISKVGFTLAIFFKCFLTTILIPLTDLPVKQEILKWSPHQI